MTSRRLGVTILLVSTVVVILIGVTGCLPPPGWHDGWGRDRDRRDRGDRDRQEERHDGDRGDGGHKDR
jgi:hypothetical protein